MLSTGRIGIIGCVWLMLLLASSTVVGAVADFNADARSDIAWWNAPGRDNALWLMNGFTVTASAPLGPVAAGWNAVGRGDFDGDGKADLLWRNSLDGNNAILKMDGLTVTAGVLIAGVTDFNWTIAGVGDFNGDGKADILWRNMITGDNIIWQMDGFTIAASAFINGVTDMNWKIAAVADFNGDGKADILWRNTSTGENAIWQMNGFTLSSSALIPTVSDVNWQIMGAGDFNGDGKADILWRSTGGADAGYNAIWQMDGFTLTSSALIPTVSDMTWTVSAVGDYDKSTKADILWHSTGGQSAIWLMDGFTMVSSSLLAGPYAPGLYYVHSDHLNSPRVITNNVGQTMWTWANDDPFGNNAPNENPSGLGAFTCNLRLPGQYFDQETNLHYNVARDYDPSIGRFIEAEPLGLRGDINLYRYARNNPLTYYDPDGAQAIPMPGLPPLGIPSPWNPRPQKPDNVFDPPAKPGWSWPLSLPSWLIPKSELDKCKDDCDQIAQREEADCEWRYKMGGRRDREGVRSCLQMARDRWVQCYRKCEDKCR